MKQFLRRIYIAGLAVGFLRVLADGALAKGPNPVRPNRAVYRVGGGFQGAGGESEERLILRDYVNSPVSTDYEGHLFVH